MARNLKRKRAYHPKNYFAVKIINEKKKCIEQFSWLKVKKMVMYIT